MTRVRFECSIGLEDKMSVLGLRILMLNCGLKEDSRVSDRPRGNSQ